MMLQKIRLALAAILVGAAAVPAVDSASADPFNHGRHVRTGEMSLYVGTEEISYTDKTLAR
jgi:hypothetical protein